MSALVQVSELVITARGADGCDVSIVKDVGFAIEQGEVLALIGESGSGKTTIALALMGHVRAGCRIAGGCIRIDDIDVRSLPAEKRRNLRGRTVAYIAQSAAASFNPGRKIMDQVIEGALVHGLMSRADAERKAIELFDALALPDAQHIGSRYPHEVSGGQLQRLMAAMALITDPKLVIFDEPTTALDVTTQIEVLRAFKKVIRERGTTAVYVSHDLAVVAQMADRIVVLNRGEIRETGSSVHILGDPSDAYTQQLLAAARPAPKAGVSKHEERTPLLTVRGLTAGYGKRDRNGLPASLVLHDIDLTIQRGATLGVIGESGSGKSTLARVIAGLIAPARGEVLLNGKPLPPDLHTRTSEQFRRIQIVFQNADLALNPAHTVERILARPLELYHRLSGAERTRRVAQLLDRVRLPASIAQRRSSELSGGQKQRINLARALAAEPDLILCDEVTSALDTVVGAAILDLLAELRRELNVAYMFISHDISTVRAICDDILVLYAGRKVEAGSREALLAPPFHPYTDLLISSVPELRPGWLEHARGRDSVNALGAAPERASHELCTFLDRCPLRVEGVCNVLTPTRRVLKDGKEVLCHRDERDLVTLATSNALAQEASR